MAEPVKNEPIDAKQVDYVTLSQGTTRAHAVTLLRGGLELEADWKEQLAKLYAEEDSHHDAIANAKIRASQEKKQQ